MKLDCNSIETIKDINDQIDYDDKVDGGSKDASEVSCGQNNSNELQNKYNEHFKTIQGIPEKLIASIMCHCCNKLKPTGKEKVSWLEFYKCMKTRVNSENHPKTFNKLNELIAWHEARNKKS
ncbi:MAG: hypothetical protein CJD30_11575 [Sulfuricurvum sp. PD_MW2]|jgi:hypothetical protein|uniref:hypothetical protein n=1 Tax=Sulfuricurvum sp. PD_MW2 TaxID=2027917 RepID=UPI000C065195|nr:hypothetical protein [Sulfuricurvum sp. PD_MW2]PHM16436.1 MAG: hypothetical protein CJD30_11575 [Sulfuricurvum sp. PD_MW2]